MNWRKLVIPISLGTLFTALIGAALAGNTVIKYGTMPERLETIEERQQSVENGLSRVEGKVDTVIRMLRR